MIGKPPAPPSRPADAPPRRSLTRLLLLVALGVLALRTLVVAPFTIPSESMLPALYQGDYLLAAKWPYGYSSLSIPFPVPAVEGRLFPRDPRRGDIVLFKHPVDGTDYIKRVIGLPGDTVAMRGGQVVLNGAVLLQTRLPDLLMPQTPNSACRGAKVTARADGPPICRYHQFREALPGGPAYPVLDLGRTPQDDAEAVRVPPGSLFVMGDNRDNSMDSRFPPRAGGGVGLLPQRLLIGRAERVLASSDGTMRWNDPASWFTALRMDRFGTDL